MKNDEQIISEIKDYLNLMTSLGFNFKYVKKKGVLKDFISVESLINEYKENFVWTNLLGVKIISSNGVFK